MKVSNDQVDISEEPEDERGKDGDALEVMSGLSKEGKFVAGLLITSQALALATIGVLLLIKFK